MFRYRTRVQWHGHRFRTGLRKRMLENQFKAGQYLAEVIKLVVSMQSNPSNPSQPGSAPYRQTGQLFNSYRAEQSVILGTTRVGSDVDWARYLEWGTTRMAPRPHIRFSLMTSMHDMGTIWCRRI